MLRSPPKRRITDESKDRDNRELAEQQWRELPAEDRELLREVIRRTHAETPDLYRAPYEEVALPEVVEEIAIRILTRIQADARARVEEHVTDEDVTRRMIEAWNLLPDDALEDIVMDVFMDIVHREGPGAIGFRGKRA